MSMQSSKKAGVFPRCTITQDLSHLIHQIKHVGKNNSAPFHLSFLLLSPVKNYKGFFWRICHDKGSHVSPQRRVGSFHIYRNGVSIHHNNEIYLGTAFWFFNKFFFEKRGFTSLPCSNQSDYAVNLGKFIENFFNVSLHT